jgi:adenosylcobyric acid synthase
MLGRSLSDPDGMEGTQTTVNGLSLLPIDTRLTPRITLRNVRGKAFGAPFTGYEMHMGVSDRQSDVKPFATLNGTAPDGAISSSGRIFGTYVHGIFQSRHFRDRLLKMLGSGSDAADQSSIIDAALDRIAQQLEEQIDMKKLFKLAETWKSINER